MGLGGDPTQCPGIMHALAEHLRLRLNGAHGRARDARWRHITYQDDGRAHGARLYGPPVPQPEAISNQDRHEYPPDDQEAPPAQHAPVLCQLHSSLPPGRRSMPCRQVTSLLRRMSRARYAWTAARTSERPGRTYRRARTTTKTDVAPTG